MVALEEVTLSHKNCSIRHCELCFAQATRLETYLHQEIDPNKNLDVLGKYRLWMDTHDIVSENEHGWILPTAYDPKNINAFIKDHKDGVYYSRKFPTEQELKDRAWSIWIDLKDIVNKKYQQDDLIFLKHPIKCSTLDLINNIGNILTEFKEVE